MELLALAAAVFIALLHHRFTQRDVVAFLGRARKVDPGSVDRYAAALAPWRFWKWSPAADDLRIADPELLRLQQELKKKRLVGALILVALPLLVFSALLAMFLPPA